MQQDFSHQLCPRCKVKRCSSCLFGKQMRQTNAAAAIKQFINLLWYCCTCIALRVLRSLSHCLQLIRHSSRQLLCPSCHLIHFVLRSATLHHVRTLTFCCKAWHTIQSTKQSTSDAHTFSQAHATILTGFHSAPLLPTFISVAFSPPAANNFACLAACHSCGFVMVFDPAHNARRPKTHAKPLRIT